MKDIDELRADFEQKEMEYNQFADVIDQLKITVEDDKIQPEKIVEFMENLIDDNAKLLEENKTLNERMEELVGGQALKAEILNE